MVKIGHDEIARIQYDPPTADAVGLEVMSIAELSHRFGRLNRSNGAGNAGGPYGAERPEFHVLFAPVEGLMWHTVDFTDYAVDAERWLWVRPGQVQQYGDLDTATGTILLFQADFIDPAVASHVRLDDLFEPNVWPVTGAQARVVAHSLEDVAREYHTSRLPPHTRAAVLQHLMAVLLLRLTDKTTQVGTPAPEHGETFQRFREAVENEYAKARDVGHYARSLGYSPRTLTRATVAAAGVGAKEFIDRRVVLEARRLLAHGDHPVVSIASRLGFADASNFVKYYTKRTGATPTAFRRRVQGGGAAPLSRMFRGV